jgi:hypothetical protein
VSKSNYDRLLTAIRMLDSFRSSLDRKYGDPALRQWDTVKYLDSIDNAMSDVERVKLYTLIRERADATSACTEDEVVRAINQVKGIKP